MNVRLQIDGHIVVINNTSREKIVDDIRREIDNLFPQEDNLVIILDCSSSMSNIAKEMTQGLNDFIQKQKDLKLEKPCRVTLIEIGSKYREIFRYRPLDQIQQIEIKPFGNTALFDGIDYAFSLFSNNDKVTCLIITDGEENSSVKVTSKYDIVEMIECKQKHGWNIVYLGADHDAFGAGTGLGVAQSASVQYNKSRGSVEAMFNQIGDKYSAIRACSATEMSFDEEDRKSLDV